MPEVVSMYVFAQNTALARGAQGVVNEEPDWTVGRASSAIALGRRDSA